MSKKFTQEKAEKRFKDKNLKLLSKYEGVNKKVLAKCSCGKEHLFWPSEVFYRDNPTCGCGMYQYNKGNKSYKWKGVGEISAHTWAGIKGNAENRNIEFDITIEEAWDKFLKQDKKCIYTNEILIFGKSFVDRNKRTASIDRINSKERYCIENIQWIHKDINNMKFDLSEEKFLYYLDRMINYIPDPFFLYESKLKHFNWKGYKDIPSTFFTRFKGNAKKRNINFSLTIEEAWNKFLEQKGLCSFTGILLSFSDNNTASIDRIDNTKGYFLENIQWVHKDINSKIKKNFSDEKVFHLAKKILEVKNENKIN